MKNSRHSEKKISNDLRFILITAFLSFLTAALYAWKGIHEGFFTGTGIIIAANLLYIPFSFLFKRKGFCYFYLIYAIVLIFILAFYKTYLYNNFTSLFIIFAVIMIKPELKIPALASYFIIVSTAFAFNEELIYHYFIHITRSVWFYYIFSFVIEKKYNRRKLILYDDEIYILNELCKNRLQKSIEFDGYSESTIYRRLKAAMTRNRLTKKELLEEFRKEYLNKENEKQENV